MTEQQIMIWYNQLDILFNRLQNLERKGVRLDRKIESLQKELNKMDESFSLIAIHSTEEIIDNEFENFQIK
jgi:hypothetical protein